MYRLSSAASLLLLVAGCAGPTDTGMHPADAGPAAAIESAAAGAGVPLAEVASDLPDLRVRLLQLTRVSRGVLEVRVAFVNAASEGQPMDIGRLLATAPDDARTLAEAFIVEPAMEKKYFVLRDAEDRPICSREVATLPPGEQVALWARFPVPAREGGRIDLHIPHASAFRALALPPPPPVAH